MSAMLASAQTEQTRSPGQALDDNVIAAKIKSTLIADPEVKGTQIGIEVFQGRVQLSGFVDNASNAQKAVSIARSVEGVVEVRNSIQVK
jgi:osmotically-inducible protein OsmY